MERPSRIPVPVAERPRAAVPVTERRRAAVPVAEQPAPRIFENGRKNPSAFVCSQCPERRYTTQLALDVHVSKRHSSYRPGLTCGNCRRSFYCIGDISDHLGAECNSACRLGTKCNTLDIYCPVCDEHFSARDDYTVKHVRSKAHVYKALQTRG